jgi:trigger factor
LFSRRNPAGPGARVAELVDALDLGSSEITSWGFESPLSHHRTEQSMHDHSTGHTAGTLDFTVTVAQTSGCKRVLSIAIPTEEVAREEARVLEELRRDLKVPGFRKGKVPARYIEKNYADAVHDDAVRNLLPAAYEEALVREGISPIGEPKFVNLKAERGESVSVDVEVEVRPEISLKDYLGVEVRVEKRAIGDKDVDETIERIREQKGAFVVVERPAKESDVVVIDYAPVGPGGETDEKKTIRNYPVELSSQSLLPEFRDGLQGIEVGGVKDIVVRYPEDFPEKALAGTEKTYRITAKEIKELRLPDIDDTFARELGEQFPDLPALRDRLRADLEGEEDKRRSHEIEERIIDRVIEANPFDVPDVMVENYLSSVLEQDRRRRPNVPDETEREKEIREHFHGAGVRTIKKFLVLEAVRKQENIRVDTAEIEAKIDEISKSAGERSEEVRAYFAHPERRRSLENELLDRKAIDLLREKAVVRGA